MGKKAAGFFYKMCLCMTLCLCIIIFLRSLVLLKDVETGQASQPGWFMCLLSIAPACFLIASACFVLYSAFADSWISKKWLPVVLFGILVLAQACFLAFVSHPMYTTDTLRVQNEAAAMLIGQNGMMSMEASYFQQYANNYFIVLLFYYYFSALNWIGITNFWMAAVVLNAVCIDIGIFLTYLAVQRLWGCKTAVLFLILCILCPVNYVWLTYVYTNTASMPFAAAVLYLFLRLQQVDLPKRQALHCVLLGLCIAIGSKLRPTTILPVIAIAIYAAVKSSLYLNKTEQAVKNSRRSLFRISGMFVKCCITAAVCVLLAFSIKLLISRHVPGGYEERNFPVTHWIMMGLNEGSSGGVSTEDVAFTKSFQTKAEKRQANLAVMKNRLKSLGVMGYVRLIVHKMDRVWAEGSDSSFEKASYAADYPVLFERVMGNDNIGFRVYTQGFRAAMFLFICVSLLAQLIQSLQGGTQDCFAYSLTLLGSIVFFILWEANPKYNVCFMPVCILLMADGIRQSKAAFDVRKKRRRLSRLMKKLAAAAVCLGCFAVICLGLHESVVKGSQIQYVYRSEMHEKGFKGKKRKLLKKAACIRQTLQAGQDCNKNSWDELKIAFKTMDKQKRPADDRYHAALYSMPDKTLLYEADITRQDLNENGEYVISSGIRQSAGDGLQNASGKAVLAQYYMLELRHIGKAYSMYPRLQLSGCLDMYPYGKLEIDGRAVTFDLCMEIYRNLAAKN